MNLAAEAIRTLVESAGPDPRRAVLAATNFAFEHSLCSEALQAIESRHTLAARWLRAALTEKASGPESACRLWSEVVSADGREIPDVLLHRARILARRGDHGQAAHLLRLALQNSHDYDLYIRAETLVLKCRNHFGCKRKLKIAVLGSSTTALLRSVLALLLLRDGIEPEFYEPPF